MAISREWVAFKDVPDEVPWNVIPYAAVSAVSPAQGGGIRIGLPDGSGVVLDQQVLASPGAPALLAEGLDGKPNVAPAARRLLHSYLEQARQSYLEQAGIERGSPGRRRLLSYLEQARPSYQEQAGRARGSWRRRRRFLVITAGGAVLAAAVGVPLALVSPGTPRAVQPGPPAAARTSPGTPTATRTSPGTPAATSAAPGSVPSSVEAVAFGPGGVLAVGDANGSTYLWDTATGHLTATLTDPAVPV